MKTRLVMKDWSEITDLLYAEYTKDKGSALAAFSNLELADPPQDGRELSVDILIGLDYYWQVMGNGFIRVDGSGPVAQQTVFGLGVVWALW
ncbi:hypothetical protein FJT64_015633 [Amphibalanus amphitrite]|uniref:Peptidase aspartic putative domain-containing protein n=1 Tax=Amphibalanus amphitrite TaxID=1232801 RepID=A0A6A4XGH7_AMPAM|nr:hypothetical protein FJT64_015633 [Amphibalanus amphitrite]